MSESPVNNIAADAPPQSGPVEVRVPVTLRTTVKKPVVTYSLLVATILIYGLQFLSQQLTGGQIDWPFVLGGKINQFILGGQFWRLITPILLHGSLLHLAFNMYALYSIGPSLERYYGHSRYISLYLIAGFTGNVASFILTISPSLGASTAIFGMVAAEGVLILRNRRMYGSKAKSMLINLGLVILVNLSLGLSAGSGIDNWGHLGGLLGGLLFAWLAGPIYRLTQNNETGGYELVDGNTRKRYWLGLLLTFGLFAIAAAVKILFLLR